MQDSSAPPQTPLVKQPDPKARVVPLDSSQLFSLFSEDSLLNRVWGRTSLSAPGRRPRVTTVHVSMETFLLLTVGAKQTRRLARGCPVGVGREAAGAVPHCRHGHWEDAVR